MNSRLAAAKWESSVSSPGIPALGSNVYVCDCSNCKSFKLNTISCPVVERNTRVLPFNSSKAAHSSKLKIGDRILVDNCWPGTVRYIGDLDGAYKGKFIGIKLDDPVGEHDGILDGKRYFLCPVNHGIIVTEDRVHLVVSKQTSKYAATKEKMRRYSLPAIANKPVQVTAPRRKTIAAPFKAPSPPTSPKPAKEWSKLSLRRRSATSKGSLSPVDQSNLKCPPQQLLCEECCSSRQKVQMNLSRRSSNATQVSDLVESPQSKSFGVKPNTAPSALPIEPSLNCLSTTPGISTAEIPPTQSFTGRLLSGMPPEEPVSADTQLKDLEQFTDWLKAWGGGPRAWTMANTLQKLKDAQRKGSAEVQWQKTIDELEMYPEYQPQIQRIRALRNELATTKAIREKLEKEVMIKSKETNKNSKLSAEIKSIQKKTEMERSLCKNLEEYIQGHELAQSLLTRFY